MKDLRLTLAAIAGLVALQATALATGAPVAPEPGTPAPAMTVDAWIAGPDGMGVSWESLRGKVVVLEFWTTWCKPCVAAIPHWNELVEKLKGEPVQFIALSNETSEKVLPFLKRNPMRGWLGLDTDSSMFEAYGRGGIPCTVLVDRMGRIVALTQPWNVTEGIIERVVKDMPVEIPVLPPPQGAFPLAEVRPDPVEGQPEPTLLVSIRPASSAQGGGRVDPNHLHLRRIPLAEIYMRAYRVPLERIDLPDGFPQDLYDVDVTVPLERANAGMYEILSRALQTAFPWEVRRTIREREVVVLRDDDKIRPKILVCTEAIPDPVPGRTQEWFPLESVASTLEQALKRPVVFETRIRGLHPSDLDWQVPADGPLEGASWFGERLGMRAALEIRPVEVLVISQPGGK